VSKEVECTNTGGRFQEGNSKEDRKVATTKKIKTAIRLILSTETAISRHIPKWILMLDAPACLVHSASVNNAMEFKSVHYLEETFFI
jgi:hypothetical protein